MSETARSVALVTPSFAGDIERARLLCDTVDARVSNVAHHYLLVDPNDVALFREFEGPNRTVIDERDILPRQFRIVTVGGRRVWLSWMNGPRALRGWHVQQLRRIAIAHHVPQDGLLYCDSDMTFVRPFDTAGLWQEGGLRLYRVADGIDENLPDGGVEHMAWTKWAHELNGLPAPSFPAADYINNLVTWRTDHVREMCRTIEDRLDTDWLAAITKRRAFSECQIYGAYADGVLSGDGHWVTHKPLCRTYWSGRSLDERSLRSFIDGMDDQQVAIGIQSFTGTDVDLIRKVVLP